MQKVCLEYTHTLKIYTAGTRTVRITMLISSWPLLSGTTAGLSLISQAFMTTVYTHDKVCHLKLIHSLIFIS